MAEPVGYNQDTGELTGGNGTSTFLDDLKEFLRNYPLQTIGIGVAFLAVMVNIRSTRSIIKALEVKR